MLIRIPLARLLIALVACTIGLLSIQPPASASNSGLIVITEIMYHPSGGGQELEFIELHNASPAPVDVSGWYFSKGISFTFPSQSFLSGGEYVVICANEQRIAATYDIDNLIGNWGLGCDLEGDERDGCALANDGETIELAEENGVVVATVGFNDRGKWPSAADGTGHTLSLIDIYSDPNDPDSWSISSAPGGTPGAANNPSTGSLTIVINEALLWTAGTRWIEFFNRSDQAVDLSGYWITNSRTIGAEDSRFQLPADTSISAGGHLALSEADLGGLDLAPAGDEEVVEGSPGRRFISLVEPNGSRVIDAYIFEPEAEEKSEARIPDGDEDISDRAVPTRGEPNRVEVESDIVINEIMYHPINGPASGDERFAEYLELYNRSADRSIDISGWKLTKGINYDFEPGTVMAPGSYLVVARDPTYIRETYGLPPEKVLGGTDGFGGLRNDGERVNLRDPEGNIADTVRYHDGGQWPYWADGGGSSMELIDPFQDNNSGASWDSSDESGKSQVREYSYQGRYNSGEPELHFLMNARGITIVDDIRMVERVITFQPEQTFLALGAQWKITPGTEEPPADWYQPDFDDSAWTAATTPVGYGEGETEDGGTTMTEMRGNHISVYMRTEFTIPDPMNIGTLRFYAAYDDGFIVYLNGTRIHIENMRTSGEDIQDTFDARARSSRERTSSGQADINMLDFMDLLIAGTNVIAIQAHNSSVNSSDFYIAPVLQSGEYVPADSENYVGNGDIEAAISSNSSRPGEWKIQGTHINSGRTTDPAEVIEGNASLKIVARGKGDNKANRLEHTLARNLRARSNYFISFKARWIAGSQTMLTRGYNHDFARSHELDIPSNLGTPGAINSVTAREAAGNAGPNIGPVIDKMVQSPNLPGNNVPVQVSCRVQDSDNITDVKLYWSLNRANSAGEGDNEISMQGPDSRGRYHATIPGQPLRRTVVFYVLARDSGGRVGRYPVDRTQRTNPSILSALDIENLDRSYCVYRHENVQRGANPSYRFWIDQDAERYLNARQLHSNDLVEGSFLFGNEDLYYHSRVRFSGSPWARQRWSESYRVSMAKDQTLHGVIKKFGLEDHQGAGARDGRERISNYLIRHNQGNTRTPYSYQWLVQWNINRGSSAGINELREFVQVPNRELIQRWYPDDDNGSFFEMDDRHEFNDGGSRTTSYDGRLSYPPYVNSPQGDPGNPPEYKENYRYYYNNRMDEGKDDFTHLVRLAQVLDRRQTPDAIFDEIIWDHMNVDAFLRCLAVRINTDDWDTWGTDRGKNCYIYRPPVDGRWVLLPWDMELTYGNGGLSRWLPSNNINAPFVTNQGKFPALHRMWNRPRIKRMYYGILWEMINHQFNSTFLGNFVSQLQRRGISSLEVARRNGFIDRRASSIRSRLIGLSSDRMALTIETNDGEAFLAGGSQATIEGRAPIDITDILVLVNGEVAPSAERAEFSNSNPLGWSVTVPLNEGANEVSFLGFNTTGGIVDQAQVIVTAPGGAPPAITSISPAQVAQGGVITIEGSNFHPGLTVSFGETLAEELDLAGLPESIVVTVPAEIPLGTAGVTVTCPGVGSSEAATVEILPPPVQFIRGDVDSSGTFGMTDPIQILLWLFRGGELACQDTADIDDDGQVNLTDAIALLNFLFQGGPAPQAPYPEAGIDPTEDELECEAPPPAG